MGEKIEGAMRYVRALSDNPEISNNKLCSRIRRGSKVLELGPASGAMTKVMKEKLDCRVSIVEIDAEAYACAVGYAENGVCGDLEDLRWADAFEKHSFDHVVMADVLEHLHNGEGVLEACASLLREDGSLLLSVPNLAHNSIIIQLLNNRFTYQSTGLLDRTHVHFFTFEELREHCARAGFSPVYMDATYVAVGKNEFDISYGDVDPLLGEMLKKRPLGEVYQYILELKGSDWLQRHPEKIEDRLGLSPVFREVVGTPATETASDDNQRFMALLGEDPNRFFTENHEIARLQGEINDLYAAEAALEKTAELMKQNFAGQEEIREKNRHIRTLDGEIATRDERIVALQAEVEEKNAHMQTLDGEIAARDERIVALQADVNEKEAHIRDLDRDMAARNERILALQAEVEEKNAHMQTLDGEIATRGERIVALQTEVEEKNNHIRTLDEEIATRDGRIETLSRETEQQKNLLEELKAALAESEKRNAAMQEEQKETQLAIRELERREAELRERQIAMETKLQQLQSERDTMETQRNELVKERDELKGYFLNQKEEIENLRTELNNKQGHIDMLLESDRELERIHSSRSWKVLTKYRNLRDKLLPRNSRRYLVLALGKKVIRHPIHTLKLMDKRRVSVFFHGLVSGEVSDTSRRMEQCMQEAAVQTEAVKQLPVVEYTNKEDVPVFAMPVSHTPQVSIIIPVYNQFHYTYACLQSIAMNSRDIPYEVIIANDCSTDLTTFLPELVKGVRMVTNEKNLRFLLNCNHAAEEAKGKYILFLNNDTQVQPGWLSSLVDLIEKDESIGMVGSKLIYPDGRLQEAGGILWKDGSAWNFGNLQDPSMPEFNYVKEADYISGAAIMIRADLWKRLGGFDEQLAPAYYEDTDLAFQVRHAGYKVLFQPKSVVVHFEGVSNGTDTSNGQKAYQVVNAKKFYEKWKQVLESEHNENGRDPFRAKDRSLNKKTILIVDHYVPMFDKDAGSRYMFHYVKMFLKMGYNVKFLGDNFYPHQPYTEVLQQMGVEVIYGNWYAQHWKEWLKDIGRDLDYVILSRPHISIKYIDIVRESSNAKIIYIGHDLHFWREEKRYETTGDEQARKDAVDWKEKELYIMRHVDMSYYLSNLEIQKIASIDPAIPTRKTPINIFDSFPDVQYEAKKRKDLLFIGGFGHAPNVDSVKWAVKEIMPLVWEKLPDVGLHIVGSNAPAEVRELAGEKVIVHGYLTDEELEGLYRNIRLELVPLRYGGGVKGKVIEAMYNGMPLVTTATGTEGIDGSEEFLLMGQTAQELADQVVRGYNDFSLLKSVSTQEKAYVKEHFSVEAALKIIGKDFDFSSQR